MGGGGGGSSYFTNSAASGVTNGSTIAGSGVTPGNATDGDNGGYGYGGAASVNGTSGLVVISVPNQTHDSSANNNDGQLSGTTSIQGKIGKGRYFNGTTDRINIGGASIVDSLANFTIDAWVYPTAQTAATHYRVFTEQLVVYVGQYGNQASFYMGNGAAWSVSETTGGTLNLNQWNHVSWVKSGTSYYIYINGQLTKSGTGAPATLGTSTNTNIIGSYNGSIQTWSGNIDEVRVSNIARTAEDIRQTYEVGLRSHTITIDFAADLDSGDLISGSGDLSFTVDATHYGLQEKADALYVGDKIIVRENYDGTEYIAQGIVNSVNAATGAVTVVSWDVTGGSTFPPVGFSTGASVFKWQREYWNITEPLHSHVDATNKLTLRMLDGVDGRNIWIDDFRSSSGYLSLPNASTITSSLTKRYFQYRTILSSFDDTVSATLSAVTLNYTANAYAATPTLTSPANGATHLSPIVSFVTSTTDGDNDYLMYKIQVCTDAAMTANCQNFDQTISQAGWANKNANGNLAYTSGSPATYTVQSALAPTTTYYWKSYAKDPAGTNTWISSQSTPNTFRTDVTSGTSTMNMQGINMQGININ
jgi:hypothetical protein